MKYSAGTKSEQFCKGVAVDLDNAVRGRLICTKQGQLVASAY